MALPPVNPFSRSPLILALESLRAKVHGVEIEIPSSDGSVTVSLSRRRGLIVVLAAEKTTRHNERTLARQIEPALSTALNRYQQSLAEIAETEFPNRRDTLGPAPGDHADIRADATSPLGYVKVTRFGERPIQIALEIRPGALRELSKEQLGAEMSEAVRQANENHDSEWASLRD